jgi:methionyl aminopeptidase
MIYCKSRRELLIMDRGNWVVLKILQELKEMVRPGLMTLDLEKHAARRMREEGVIPAFLGYRGYPTVLCISLNEQVVHGIPGPRKIQEGDIVSIDCGVTLEGYYGDAAITVPVGNVSEEDNRLVEATRRALELAVEAARVGARVSDISCAIQSHIESNGFAVIREFAGHGIGTSLHEEPQVPNFGKRGFGPKLREGMVLAIEPMVSRGDWRVTIAEDNWTASTMDGSRAAHFEYSVAITGERGPWILGLGEPPRRADGDVL